LFGFLLKVLALGFVMRMVGGPTRQDTWRITVFVEHPKVSGSMLNYGVFDKMTGGQVDSDDNKYNPGGMGPPVSLGGRKTVDNVVISRLYRLMRDHDHIQRLIDGVGRSRVTIAKQPMDIEGNVYGKPLVYNGRLKRCTPPEVDSEASGAGLIELEVVVDGFPVKAP
jgi:hypothetical protein